MEKSEGYPLEQVAIIKQKKLDEAEKVLREKKALEREEEKLKEVEKERDEVKDHRMAKLTQVREKMDAGAPSDKIQQMRVYLKVVDEKLKAKELKVKEQLKHVENAKQQVEVARKDLIKKQHDVEKMQMHRKEWEQEIKVLEAHKESVESDELGAIMHQRKKRSDSHAKKKKHTS